MADFLSRAGRSTLMAKVRGRGNASTELALARVLRAEGLVGWRRQLRLGGGRGAAAWKVRPDFVFPRLRWVLFVDGCFWHGCPRCYRTPTNNAQWWEDKIATNRRRDARQSRQLRRMGYSVVRLREHETSEAWVRRLARVLNVCG